MAEQPASDSPSEFWLFGYGYDVALVVKTHAADRPVEA